MSRWNAYRSDPVTFARDVLGVQLWGRQAQVLAALAGADKVAVRAGRKVGKSRVAAVAALWWWACRDGGRVLLMAPTGRQVRAILWREVQGLYRGAVAELGGHLYELPDRGLQWDENGDRREIVGFSTDQPENLQGYSGANMLFIIDEASGVEESMFEVMRGNLMGGGKIMLTGNPTRTSGTFYDAFNSKKSPYKQIKISSLESPNITPTGKRAKKQISGLATAASVAELREEWGEESALWQIHVCGEFASEADNTVISIAVADAAQERYRRWEFAGAIQPPDELQVGVDPARFGDDESVVFLRRGNLAFGSHCFKKLDQVTLAERVVDIVNDNRRGDEQITVRVDSVGIGGGTADILRRNPSFRTIDVDVAKAANIEGFSRLRDELWFGIRDWLRGGGMIPGDDVLYRQLIAPAYEFDDRNKIKVESKDTTKKKLKGKSPDRADALMLAIAQRGTLPASFNGVKWKGLAPTFGGDWHGREDSEDDPTQDPESMWYGARVERL